MSATQDSQQTVVEPSLETVENTGDNTNTRTQPQSQYDTIVIYTDGSFNEEKNFSGTGFVLEKRCGDEILTNWSVEPNARTSLDTEAQAVLKAVREAKRFRPSFIILYSDCQPVLDRLEQDHEPRNMKQVYREIRVELETVDITSLNHIPRDRNTRAHDLAHRALREREVMDGNILT